MKAIEKSYRLYSCARCCVQVSICGRCDRGNRYCAEGCAQIRRLESHCRSAERYQQSHRGASNHAARQRLWRERRVQIVTHQGSLAMASALKVASCSTATLTQEPHAQTIGIKPLLPIGIRRAYPHATLAQRQHALRCCCFCADVLPLFVRLGPRRHGP